MTQRTLQPATILVWLLFVLLDSSEAFLTPTAKTRSTTSTSTLLRAATGIRLEDGAAANVSPAEVDTNIGVLLLNLGGPETGEDVEGEPAAMTSI